MTFKVIAFLIRRFLTPAVYWIVCYEPAGTFKATWLSRAYWERYAYHLDVCMFTEDEKLLPNFWVFVFSFLNISSSTLLISHPSKDVHEKRFECQFSHANLPSDESKLEKNLYMSYSLIVYTYNKFPSILRPIPLISLILAPQPQLPPQTNLQTQLLRL